MSHKIKKRKHEENVLLMDTQKQKIIHSRLEKRNKFCDFNVSDVTTEKVPNVDVDIEESKSRNGISPCLSSLTKKSNLTLETSSSVSKNELGIFDLNKIYRDSDLNRKISEAWSSSSSFVTGE